MIRKCSHCFDSMRTSLVSGVELDICCNCGGTWFDAEELRKLVQGGPQALTQLEERTIAHVDPVPPGPIDMHCPDCKVSLDSNHYQYNSPIVLHACPHCEGFWIAEGEVGKIQAWRDQSQHSLSPKGEAAEAIAIATTAHEQEMHRLRNLTRFCSAMRTRQGGFFTFHP